MRVEIGIVLLSLDNDIEWRREWQEILDSFCLVSGGESERMRIGGGQGKMDH